MERQYGDTHEMDWKQKQQDRINEFMTQRGDEFLVDFPIFTYDELTAKYNISYHIIKQIESHLGLVKNTEYLAKQKANRQSASMKNGGTEKCQQTHLQRYGVKTALVLPSTRKIIQEKTNTPETIAKFKQTCQSRYGVDTPLNLPEVRAKSIECAHTDASLEKTRKTREALYGVPYSLPPIEPSHTAEAQAKREQTRLERYGTLCGWNHKKIQQTLIDRYGVNCSYFVGDTTYNRISKLNKSFAKTFQDLGIDVEFEKCVNGHSYDLGIGRFLVELNPTVSHNYLVSFGQLTGVDLSSSPRPQNYHYKLWQQASENGYELLSLFDWVDSDAFKEFILSKLGVNQIKVGARKFTVMTISKHRANSFLDENHLLKSCRGNELNLALVDKTSKIYAVMTFGKPRYSKAQFDFELLRFATLVGYSIAGGASKLFSYFKQLYPKASVITYSDNNLGKGNVYKLLGFQEIGQTGPSVTWVDIRTNKCIKDLSVVRQGADRLLARLIPNYFFVGLDKEDFIQRGGKQEYAKEFELYGDDWFPGNRDIMLHYNFYPVADCGATIWSYNKN